MDQMNVNYRWIPVDALKLEGKFQRTKDEKRISRYAADYDVRLVNAPVVCPTGSNGEYVIVDGQHTVAVEQIKDREAVYCRVVEEYDEAEQAALFIKLNEERARLEQSGSFKAGIVAGKPWALALQRAIKASPYRLPENVSCVGKLREIISSKASTLYGGERLVYDVLTITHRAYGDDRYAKSSEVAAALARFLVLYGHSHAQNVAHFADLLNARYPTAGDLRIAANEVLFSERKEATHTARVEAMVRLMLAVASKRHARA